MVLPALCKYFVQSSPLLPLTPLVFFAPRLPSWDLTDSRRSQWLRVSCAAGHSFGLRGNTGKCLERG